MAKAREMVRTAGGDPDKKPHVVGPKAVAMPIVPAVPAPGTTRTVRFDFRDEMLTNSGTRSQSQEQWLADTKLFHLDRQARSKARGTYRIEVVDRHGKSHWGPPYVTREDALADMPKAVGERQRGQGGYGHAVRMGADRPPRRRRQMDSYLVLVCGSRIWTDKHAVDERIAALPEYAHVLVGYDPEKRTPRGVDRYAYHAARDRGLRVTPYPADWSSPAGRGAGFIRNLAMLDRGPSLVIAFQHSASRGTQHTIDNARKRGIAVELHTA